MPKHVLLGSFPVFCIPGISYMYFFDIAVLRYSGDKKFDYLFFDKKRFENRYNITAISEDIAIITPPPYFSDRRSRSDFPRKSLTAKVVRRTTKDTDTQ